MYNSITATRHSHNNLFLSFFFKYTTPTAIYTLSLHDALPIYRRDAGFRATNGEIVTVGRVDQKGRIHLRDGRVLPGNYKRSEEHTSELQSHSDLVCRLLLEKKKTLALRTSATRKIRQLSRN